MTSEEIKSLTGQYVMNTYGRFPVAIDHGEGARLYDPEGREYIDFTSGIGVTDLGYGYQPWADAVAAQAKKLSHVSNLFYTEPPALLAKTLCERTGESCVFFANGGGEANEGMIKLARKYSFDKYGKGRAAIITLNNSFHDRTITPSWPPARRCSTTTSSPSPRASATPTPTAWNLWRPPQATMSAPSWWSWSRARAACYLWTRST